MNKYNIYRLNSTGGATWTIGPVDGSSAADALTRAANENVRRLLDAGDLCFVQPVHADGKATNPNGSQCVFRLQEPRVVPRLEAVPASI